MKIRCVVLVFILLSSALLALTFTTRAAAQSDLATVKSRMLADALDNAGFKAETGPTDFTQVDTYLTTLATNGSWSDIDYQDSSNNFPALKHLDRILVMSYTYSKSGGTLYKSAALLSAINKALGYWYQVNPVCDNWYKNRIGKQYYLGPIGLMMQGAIETAYLTKITSDLTDAPSMTGANKTALSTSVIYRAVIEGNAARLASGATGVESVIAITSGDGIQRDNSFQQHGGILYNGNYGFAFLRDVLWVGTMLTGTQYAFTAPQIALLRDNYLEGTRWMFRGGLLDYNVRGRDIGSSRGNRLGGDTFFPILDHFIHVDPANQSAYQASKDNIANARPQAVSGTRHYWNSDYTAVQRSAYFASVKMCSKRTRGMERDVNSENLLGYWLPYGFTYTYQRGDEFNYIFPIWDWARLPGVTNPHVEISVADNPTTYTSQSTSFVGGASDGTYGATAMDFSLEQTTAKKSWFWFDKEWVALGAGITSSHAKPVFTSIQQVLLKGSVVADGTSFSGTAKALVDPKWVLHDGIGYVFPEPQTVQIQATSQTGSVKRFFGLGSDAPVSGDVFSLWFDHGQGPKAKTYQYVVVPGIAQAALDQYSKNIPVAVLSNSAAIQAVTHKNLRVTGAVFFQAGGVSVPQGPSVKVDAPSVVVLNEPAGTVAVSDPNGSLSKVMVTVVNVSGASKSQSVSLPTGDNAGKSVIVSTLLDKRPAIDDGSGGSSDGAAGATAVGGAAAGAADEGGGSSGGADAVGGSAAVGEGGSATSSPGGATSSSSGTSSTSTPAPTDSTSSGPDSGGCTCSLPCPPNDTGDALLLGFAAVGASVRARRSRKRY